jgi:hypothetical protein
MDSSLVLAAATAMLTHVPVFLVWIVGAILALVRPSVPRRVARFLVGGLAVHVAQAVVGTGVSVILPFKLREGGASMAQVGTYLAVWSLAWSLISAAAWVLVLLAVFAEREPPNGALPVTMGR